MSWWPFVTALGDTGVVLPAFAFAAGWLAVRRQVGMCLSWTMLLMLVGGVVIASKLAFMTWNLGIGALDFTGLSGHTAMSVVVWPPLCVLLARREGCQRAVAGMAGVVLALLIAWSRIELHAHSVSEVVGALLIGLPGVAILFRTRWSYWAVSGGRMLLIFALLAMLPLTYGHRFPSDKILRFAAMQLRPNHTIYRRDLLR